MRIRLLILIVSVIQFLAGPVSAAEPTSLAGEWRFSMDRQDVGANEQWFSKDLADRIKLPGILQAQGYGDEISVDTPWVAALPRDMRWYLKPQYAAYTKPGNVKMPWLAQPPRHYLGVAWYQRDIEIPEGWRGKRVQLFLERPRWETTVWIDGRKVSSNNSLVAPHEYELGILEPGAHKVSIRADNRMILPYRPDGHSVSDALGATWNGIVGRIELRATSPVWIDDAQAFPDVQKKSAKLKVQIRNASGEAGAGTLSAGGASTAVQWDASGGNAELNVELGDRAQTWDEFHPVLHRLTVQLKSDSAAADDSREVVFGLREIKADGRNILLNGREINFRGTHSGGDFPLTGYPATDVASWKKLIQTCKDFGLNHIRFHSWCPPEAAFTAADELGFYLQPECGMWNDFSRPGNPEMLEAETQRMYRAYGNHPSLVLWSPTNEPAGRWQQVLEPWTVAWYQRDPRRIYAANTGRANPRAPGPQYALVPYRGPRGWWGNDYSSLLTNVRVPVLTHEVGQWCAYPDYDVIRKFTGYLQPSNYEVFRDSAAAHGVLERNKEFAHTSGKFQVACYKEEIEANLRTAGLAGFQLLDLHDYLGQGTALVGVLDPFWESKGYVTAEEFRRFSGPTVPLARVRQHVLRTSEKLQVDVEIAHYGPQPLIAQASGWRIVDSNGASAARGEFAPRDIPIGKSIPLGKIEADLASLAAPKQYKLVVGLAGTNFENDWDFWLYPAAVDTIAPAEVLVTDDWARAQTSLASGGKVIFTPPAASLDDTSPPLSNTPVFWNRLMNPKLDAMMGLWCDVNHPALAGFPTEAFCDWQWTDLVRNMRAINVEPAPPQLRPIVSAIDDWNRNYKLAVLFECTIGTGNLLVCAPDIQSNLENRTVARQLRRSLLDYVASDRFKPQVAMSAEQASRLWPGRTAATTAPATAPGALPGDLIESPNVAPRTR